MNSRSSIGIENTFHQRRASLTTTFPSPDKRHLTQGFLKLDQTNRQKHAWIIKHILRMSFIQLVGWSYLLICFGLSTIHLINSFSLLDPTNTLLSRRYYNHEPPIDWDTKLFKNQNISLMSNMLPEARLSKIFSKSAISNELIRPYWFTASIKPAKDALTLTTVVELQHLDLLVKLAELYKGPISATIIVPSTKDMHHETSIQLLTDIRHQYETRLHLKRHVDLHLIFQPGKKNIHHIYGYQKARNMARLFSRTDYVALVPVELIFLSPISSTFKQYLELLDRGDLLILPTFGFPQYSDLVIDSWPTDKQSTIEWVESGELGLLDYPFELNNGPTDFSTWKEAKEPYLVPNYDYKYGPIFISTKLNHPWCDERFEDYLPSCLFNIYLSGANLWVLPQDYVVTTGQDSLNSFMTPQQKKIQNKIAAKYRVEQCVFYARQFDQMNIFETENAEHLKQECSKAILNLQKDKLIKKIFEDDT